MKIVRNVAVIIPLKTAVPRARLAPELAPVAITSGKTPRINANDVIKIGRKRGRAASLAAWRIESP